MLMPVIIEGGRLARHQSISVRTTGFDASSTNALSGHDTEGVALRHYHRYFSAPGAIERLALAGRFIVTALPLNKISGLIIKYAGVFSSHRRALHAGSRC